MIRMMVESSDKSANCFPGRVQIDLKQRNVNVIGNVQVILYSCTLLTIVSITVVMAASQLSWLSQNNQTAHQLSIMSLTMSMIVNFCLFWQHFMFTNTSSVYDFLRFPAITFFVLSFIFQMRVLQEVIKTRYREEERRVLKRRFLIFYVIVYTSIIVFFIF